MSSDTDDEMFVMWHILRKRQKKRSMWVREIFLQREHLGEFHQYVPQLKNDPSKFYNYYRMSQHCYQALLGKVSPCINLGHTNYRKTISVDERLTVTLRFLAVGEPFTAASHHFCISASALGKIVRQMLEAIYNVLNEEYLPCPTEKYWRKCAKKFKEKKQFPICIGALDGKHVRIKKPKNCGSLYYNYKHYHSIVLLALVDADYMFSIIDIGSYGKNSDGGIFEHSNFGKALKNNSINIPEDAPIISGGEVMPFVIVADEAFRLTRNVMKPYPRRDLTANKRVFNYRLSAARQMVECTFGILVSKFRIFDTPIAVDPSVTDSIIKAACVLHNYIRTADKDDIDIEYSNSSMPGAFEALKGFQGVNQSSKEARDVREKFMDYFNAASAIDD